jgi:hypothetical protein
LKPSQLPDIRSWLQKVRAGKSKIGSENNPKIILR